MICKRVGILVGMLASFSFGFVYSNYIWHKEYLPSLFNMPQISVVETSVIYMEKYQSGDKEAAHKWISYQALQDPSGNVHVCNSFECWQEAINFSSLEHMKKLGNLHLSEVKARQSSLQTGDSSNGL